MGIFDFFFEHSWLGSKQGIFEDKRDRASCQKPFTLGVFSSCATTAYLYRCLIKHQIYLAALYFENWGFFSTKETPPKLGISFCCWNCWETENHMFRAGAGVRGCTGDGRWSWCVPAATAVYEGLARACGSSAWGERAEPQGGNISAPVM